MITTYDYIDANKRKTVLLIILFPVSLLLLLFVILYLIIYLFPPDKTAQNYSTLSIIMDVYWPLFFVCLVFSTLWTVVTYYHGTDIVLRTIEVYKTEKELPDKQTMRILENVAITAGIPTPNLYILYREKGLNAFALGSNKNNATVILTKGLIDTLEKSELEAVIAHEVAHILHKDTRLMMIITLLIGFFSYFGYIIIRSQLLGRSSRKSDGKGGAILLGVGLAFLIYGYVVAPLIRLAVSRTREFEADAKSALLTRNPQALISALEKISNSPIVDVLNSKFNNNEFVAPMCIESPLKRKVSLFDFLSQLSSTHPPIEKRITALKVMDGTGLSPY